MKNLKVFVVSDSVGETGEQVVKAAVSQFRPNFDNTVIRKFPNIENNDHIEKLLKLLKNKMQLLFLR